MSQFTAAKLALRVGLGFAILMVSILLLGIGLGVSVDKTYKHMAAQSYQSHEAARSVQEIKIQIGQLRRFEKDYFLQLQSSQLQVQNIGLWYQSFNRIERELLSLEQTLPAQHQPTLLLCRQKLTNYKFGFEMIRAQIKTKQIQSPVEANEEFGIYKHFIYQLDEAISELAKKTEQQELVVIAKINDLRIARLWQMAVAVLLCFGLSGVLAFIVSRYSFKISKELEHRAEHDPLTGLLNRRGFERQINQQTHKQGALLYLDLDQFKLINDLCGHNVGDDLLITLSHRFVGALPNSALTARLGGDEFGIYLPEYNIEMANSVALDLLQLIQNYPFSSQGRMFSLNGSIGISIRDEQSHYLELISRADTACYIAKERGTGQIAHSNDIDNQHEQLQSQMSWAAKIPLMLQNNQFILYYQKMENLQNAEAALGHAEILIRGLDDEGKIVPPGFFLPAAERFNLINRIDRWVAHAVLNRQLPPNLVFAINLSGPSIGDKSFLRTLEEWIKASPLPAQQICLEITETAAMTDMSSAIHFISTLKALGCRFALDDFGSGFSSFSYLKDLHVDYLKIDGSMIRNLERNESDVALVTAIIQMAKALKLRTIAEFVENDAQKEILRRLGVDYAQGFGIHKPEALPILH